MFQNVGGLQAGNGVFIAGVNVGTVEQISFRNDGRVEVGFHVVSSSAHLIRGNPDSPPKATDPPSAPKPSIVHIGTKGALGDRQLQISVGDRSFSEWPLERPLFSNEEGGLMAMVESAASEVELTAENLRLMTRPLSRPTNVQRLA